MCLSVTCGNTANIPACHRKGHVFPSDNGFVIGPVNMIAICW